MVELAHPNLRVLPIARFPLDPFEREFLERLAEVGGGELLDHGSGGGDG